LTEYRNKWCDSLLPEEQNLWRSLPLIRGREVHEERAKTTAKEKAIALRLDYSKASQAYRAFYVMQQACVFAGVSALENELSLPPGTTSCSYIKEHWFEIEGKSRPIAEISDQIVKLCECFVQYLETVIS